MAGKLKGSGTTAGYSQPGKGRGQSSKTSKSVLTGGSRTTKGVGSSKTPKTNKYGDLVGTLKGPQG